MKDFFCVYRFGDHYEWNKVTSCIHNILSGQRWIEHYGEMAIKNINSDDCQCKITFVKVRRPSIHFKLLSLLMRMLSCNLAEECKEITHAYQFSTFVNLL